MKLTIKRPEDEQMHDIVWFDCSIPSGNIIIQPGHAPTIFALKPYSTCTFCFENGKQSSIPVGWGTVIVERTSITALISPP